MKCKVKNKRRFGFWCLLFFFMLVNLVFALNKRLSQFSNSALNKATNYVVLSAHKDGSISFSENKYFKRYEISCKYSSSEARWEENKEYIDVTLKKEEIDRLNLKSENSSNRNDIYYETSGENIIIKIKKNFHENNLVYLSSIDKKKIVVLAAKVEKPFRQTVVLDAGHGGEDKGANVNGIYEKDITLKIVNYTADEMMFNGFKVVKTRNEDRLIYLNDIPKIANESISDLFVSIHINSNKLEKYSGITTYYFDPDGFQKDERQKLARTMQKELVKSDSWEDRGIARNNLLVLRNSQVPCVLLELGFLSNSEDREKLLKDGVLQNFSHNITKGIENYFSAE